MKAAALPLVRDWLSGSSVLVRGARPCAFAWVSWFSWGVQRVLYWLIVTCCLSLWKADSGSAEALPYLWQTCLCQVSSRHPWPMSGWPPKPVTGQRKNGKSAQETKHHALENWKRSHAPKRLLLVIPWHQDSGGGNGSPKFIQETQLWSAHDFVQVRKQLSLLLQQHWLDVVNSVLSLLPLSSYPVFCPSFLLAAC